MPAGPTAPKKTATTGKAGTTGKAAAARKEIAGGSHTIAWRGATFDLPPKLPADLAWALADLEAAAKSGVNQVSPMIDLLDTLLGEQVLKVRLQLRDDGITIDEFPEVIQELFQVIFAVYGIAEGESAASA